jgi:hypothetical protein
VCPKYEWQSTYQIIKNKKKVWICKETKGWNAILRKQPTMLHHILVSSPIPPHAHTTHSFACWLPNISREMPAVLQQGNLSSKDFSMNITIMSTINHHICIYSSSFILLLNLECKIQYKLYLIQIKLVCVSHDWWVKNFTNEDKQKGDGRRTGCCSLFHEVVNDVRLKI